MKTILYSLLLVLFLSGLNSQLYAQTTSTDTGELIFSDIQDLSEVDALQPQIQLQY
ncbi:hypothetical protein L3C95_14545 [Chitinophaga filiformis]|uniref:hypothetical protein n=1 Tax=Chitinophaga filiformis TaxID=104663 RepID=UPI001F3D1BFD|nr:hypothetical protein [Chitinophaga filiformis]MCF6404110.1 hypothetical protein [Chitinophaga filiformis]